MVLKRSSLRKADLWIHVPVQARCGHGRENIIPILFHDRSVLLTCAKRVSVKIYEIISIMAKISLHKIVEVALN